MPTKKVEVIHTKELIDYAFKQLLAEKEYDKITVMDISNKANINRATFYLHFKDKKSLYTMYNEQFFYKIGGILNNILAPEYVNKRLDQYVTTPFPPIAEMFSYMKKEETLTNCLLGMKGLRENAIQLEKMLEQYYLRFYKKEQSPLLYPEERETYERYILKAAMGIIYGWIDEGMRRSPEEMAILFVRISLRL